MTRPVLALAALLALGACADEDDTSDYPAKMALCFQACEERAAAESVEITLYQCGTTDNVRCSCVAPGEEPCADSFQP